MPPDSSVLVSLAAALAVLLATAGALVRARRWRRGRPAEVRVLQGLARLPGRYLRDLHDVVARDPASSRMHVPVASGLLATVATLLACALGWQGAPAAGVLALSASVLVVGAALAARRRQVHPRALAGHLSQGAWQRLPFLLGAFGIGALLIAALLADALPGNAAAAARAAAVALALPALVAIALAGWTGPLRHAYTGALHLAFHPRPTRFTDAAGERTARPPTALHPLPLDAEPLGVERPTEFRWNELLGFDACVQCGRCEAACPAHAAGQPLNPKKLIQDLAAAALAPVGSAPAYAGHGHPGQPATLPAGAPGAMLIGGAISAQTLWACTTCRACVYECPMMIEHVDAVVALRRAETLRYGRLPAAGATLLDNLRMTDNQRGLDPALRRDWARDLPVPLLRDVGEAEYLLWAGDFAFEARTQNTLRALARSLATAGVSFAILGDEEADSGDTARRLGDEATFLALVARNAATLARYRFRRIVTPDPHALHSLAREYATLGHVYDVVHHSVLLAELLAAGRLPLRTPLARRVTYHDPCYLGRYAGELEAPRAVLGAIGAELVEMTRSGRRSRCCGGGGGAPLADVPGARRIPDMRIDDARETGAAIVAVACPQCSVMLEGVALPRPEIRDLAELVDEAVRS